MPSGAREFRLDEKESLLPWLEPRREDDEWKNCSAGN